jgi:hypothetical protein
MAPQATCPPGQRRVARPAGRSAGARAGAGAGLEKGLRTMTYSVIATCDDPVVRDRAHQ